MPPKAGVRPRVLGPRFERACPRRTLSWEAEKFVSRGYSEPVSAALPGPLEVHSDSSYQCVARNA
jgi:hypothetical protein